jgi:hypothetical protein
VALDLPADVPAAPDATDREWLLDALAELVEHRGAEALLAPPVVPGAKAFPERWRPTRAGVTEVARRCAAHAGLVGVRIDVVDGRDAGFSVDPTAPTELEVDAVAPTSATLVLAVLGRDDVAGAACHAIGAVIAALGRIAQAGPFRSTDEVGGDEDTRRRGAVAAVWAGLGVLAANAAYQQYTYGTPINGYAPIDYRVVQAGAVPMSALAFLVAVQAELRGATGLPEGLKGPQRDETRAWRKALAGRGAALRDRLGIAAGARGADRRPPLAAIDCEPEDVGGGAGAGVGVGVVVGGGGGGGVGVGGGGGGVGGVGGGGGRDDGEHPGAAADASSVVIATDDEGFDPERLAHGEVQRVRGAPGRPVFRVMQNASGIGTLLGMLAGGIAAGILLPTPIGLGAGLIAGGFTGFATGRRRTHARCADCDIALPLDASICPRCRGILGRVIRHRNDRLDEAERDTGGADDAGEAA